MLHVHVGRTTAESFGSHGEPCGMGRSKMNALTEVTSKRRWEESNVIYRAFSIETADTR